jgi:hypothetical protein
VEPSGTDPSAPEEAEGPDPAREREIDEWIARLRDPDDDIVFSATMELARLGALRAASALVEVLDKHRDFYARLGAATALGQLKACDAVPDLIEALDDKDDLVRTAANDALMLITDQNFNFVPGMSRVERGRVQKKFKDWWRDHEIEVRVRLGQERPA